MSLTSNLFIIFFAVLLILYYAFPKKNRWILLLVGSYAFYLLSGINMVIFLLYSTVITYAVGRMIDHTYRTIENAAEARKKAHGYVAWGIILDLAMLCVLKYTNFLILTFNQAAGTSFPVLRLILPLGISYYTFQTIGYILDVYWKRIEAEQNFAKFALFVSFFPQLIQGPIGRYSTLASQLTEGHDFSWKNIRYGLIRIVWGLFKSILLADWAAVFREAIFADPETYAGIAVWGVLMYTIELYGSFSGGIDIVIGLSEMLGIALDENFRQPFFSTSISNFWQRWHITLGTWMKDYVLYPLDFSRFMRSIGKKAKKRFGKKTGRLIPACLSSLIIFLLVGIWHGANWNNIGWGIYNGVIIAFSNLMSGVYAACKKKLKINDSSRGWYVWMVVRTFILTNIGWYFDCASSFKQALTMMLYSVTRFRPSLFLQIPAGQLGCEYTPYALLTLALGVILLTVVSILKERGMKIRDQLSSMPLLLQFLLCLILLILTALLSPMAAARGFIYAQF